MSLGGPAQNFNTGLGSIGVTTEDGIRWLQIPTSSQASRNFLLQLAVNDEEIRLINMPSRDIEIRLSDGKTIPQMAASIIRREDYFRAVLIQSRGVASSRPCGNKCATTGNPRFRMCVRLPSYREGACGECVWQSHGAYCTHKGAGDGSSGDDNGGGDGGNNGGGGGGSYKKPSVKRGRETRTPGKRVGKNVGQSGSLLGSAAQPFLIEKE